MLRQRLQQKLLLRLSPQQIQLMKLLMVPTANLEQRIKEEIETNPALEEGEDGEEETTPEAEENATPEAETNETETEPAEAEEQIKVEDDVDMSEYYDEDDDGVASYRTEDPN